jgi:hypothetical protein
MLSEYAVVDLEGNSENYAERIRKLLDSDEIFTRVTPGEYNHQSTGTNIRIIGKRKKETTIIISSESGKEIREDETRIRYTRRLLSDKLGTADLRF